MKLYEILTEQRKKKGMSIEDLVKTSGVPKGTVSKILAGFTENPGIETLKSITYALGLSLEDLDDKEQPADLGELSADELEFASVVESLTPQRRHLLLVLAKALLQDQEEFPEPRE